jgi:hypothetical protein
MIRSPLFQMKVGILTFHRGPNYGGYLQAWHLREAIRRLGHQVEIINYQNPLLYESEKPVIRSFKPSLIRHSWRRWVKSRPFKESIKHFSSFPLAFDASLIPWSNYDTIVVGSDVVWDFQTPQFGHDRAYFGMHPAQKGCRFVSYAASCGPADVDAKFPDWVREGISRFSAIGVRDENTFRLAKASTYAEPSLVVDPTWLQDDPPPSRSVVPDRPYILVYGNALDQDRAKALRAHAARHSLDLIGCASCWKHVDHVINGIDPLQWAELFRGSQSVVTSTFHGLLYAIKNSKPFLMVNLPAAANKSKTVVERVGATARVISPDRGFADRHLDLLLAKDAPSPDREWIERSSLYLREALSQRSVLQLKSDPN